MKYKRLFYSTQVLLIYLGLFLQSCHTEKKIGSLVYFNQQGDTALSKIVQNYEAVIQPGDRLSIVVNALDPASTAPYNLGSSFSAASSESSSSAGGSNAGGYLVEADGTIHFPQLGKIQVAGLHRKQLVDTLSKFLAKYVTDPIVTITFLNFKITVLGEVGRQGTFTVPEGKMNLVEAIGLAGDLTITGRRDNITVIREKDGRREFGKVNMLSKDAFSSRYFVLQQNDVVYVEMTNEKAASTDQSVAQIRSNIGLVTSALSILTTLILLVFTLKK